MSFERACALADLRDDEPLAVTVGEYDVALVKDGEEVFAIEDMCSHASVPLSEGDVEVGSDRACTIECYLHGSTFDLRTGKPTVPPATEPVATFPVEIREGDVYIDTTTTLNGVPPQ